jgi:hypothetical protein
MDIREALLEEHSKSQRNKIVKYIGTDKKKFAELMRVFFGNENGVTQRAAWPLSYSVAEHPELITPYLGRLINMLVKPGVHNAVTRNITRLLQTVEIPRTYHGKIMTACFQFISDINTPAAVKAFSLTLLDNLSREYPEITTELKLIIVDRWNDETPAFKSRAKKILRRIEKHTLSDDRQ